MQWNNNKKRVFTINEPHCTQFQEPVKLMCVNCITMQISQKRKLRFIGTNQAQKDIFTINKPHHSYFQEPGIKQD